MNRTSEQRTMLRVASPSFLDGDQLPDRYATERAGGRNESPGVEWGSVPEGTQSIAIAMIDRHPVAHDFVHWIVVNLPANTKWIGEGDSGRLPAGSRELRGTNGEVGYHGPTPPPGSGPHPYELRVWALDTIDPPLPTQPSWRDIEAALEPHALASGSLTGYSGR